MENREILYARISIQNMIFLEKLSKNNELPKGTIIDELLKSTRLNKKFDLKPKHDRHKESKFVEKSKKRISELEKKKSARKIASS